MPYFYVLIGILGFLVGGAGFVKSAAAATTITSCGTIRTDVILGTNLRSTNEDCITIGADNITIDGNGKTITVPSNRRAVTLTNRSNVTVKNLRSNGDLQIYGATADGNRIENSTLAGMAVYMGDDTTITGNQLGWLTVHGLYNDPAQRATITNNIIKGPANRLVDIMAGGDGTRLCVEGHHVISGNQFINTATAFNPDSPIALYYRCTKNSQITDNYIRGTGLAQGIRMRDEADGNIVTGNTVIVNQTERAALMLSSGNVDKDFPSNNLFADNTFRGQRTRSVFIQAQGANNRYERNLFWSNALEGGIITVGPNTVFDYNTFVNSSGRPSGTWRGRLITLDNHDNAALNFTNNNLIQLGPSSFIFAFDGFNQTVYSGNHNLFWQSPGGLNFTNIGGLSSWRTVTGDDAASLTTDPLVRSVRQGDLTLLATSPARGAADNGSDLGAYQFSDGYCGSNWLRPRFNPAPRILTVSPSVAPRNANTTITITGRNFRTGTRVYLGKTRLTTTVQSSSILAAVIPSTVPVGTYDLIVRARGACVRPQSITVTQ